jgi:hypothetical protein
MDSSQAAFEAQARWETIGCERAARQYRQGLRGKALAETAGGKSALRQLIEPLEKAVKVLQSQIANPPTGQRALAYLTPLLLLPADKIAVIGLTTSFRTQVDRPPEGDVLGTIRATVLSIGTAIRLQIDFDAWKAAAPEEIVSAVQRRFPDLNVRQWRRLQDRLDGAIKTIWETDQRYRIGGAVLKCLLDALPTWFSQSTKTTRDGRSEGILVLSESASEFLHDRAIRAEVARPLLFPMICPPIPWAYEPQGVSI